MTLTQRPRRLRSSAAMRELVAEFRIGPENLMAPIFIHEGVESPREISSMPGVFHNPLTALPGLLDEAIAAGVVSVMLFAIPAKRDANGSQACHPEGILSRAVAVAAKHAGDRLVVVADLCLDEFTDHGHCGVLDENGAVDNDRTLELYGEMAVVLAQSGVTMVGTSGMMDGQVGAVRGALDAAGFSEVGILAYAAKYASSMYGPFRDAVESSLQGDRRAYQQDWRNRREALREISLDIDEGADIVMVKPALGYLDIISDAAEVSPVPIAAYIVSGEYAMVELAALNGLIDRERAIYEILSSVRRAGATIVCTYWAIEWAKRLGKRDAR
jgi:porphobilinogen synthase